MEMFLSYYKKMLSYHCSVPIFYAAVVKSQESATQRISKMYKELLGKLGTRRSSKGEG